MTFDVNLINVVNNFSRNQDLTYSLTGTYVQGANGETQSGTVQAVTDESTGVSDTTHREALSITNHEVPTAVNSVTYAQGSTNPTFAPSTAVNKVVRVFIPARAKISFTMRFNYAYLAETSQNEDQGKYYRSTVSITANGLDNAAGNAANGEYATNTDTPATNTPVSNS